MVRKTENFLTIPISLGLWSQEHKQSKTLSKCGDRTALPLALKPTTKLYNYPSIAPTRKSRTTGADCELSMRNHELRCLTMIRHGFLSPQSRFSSRGLKPILS